MKPVHLMIVEPERHIDAFAEAGAAVITVHQETCPHLHMTLRNIRKLGCKAGVSINPGTPIAAIEPVLVDVDVILVMTVNPGWGGQSAIQSAIDKTTVLREMLDARGLHDVLIEVDGGVKVDNIADFGAADVFVSGSGIFKSDDYAATITAMRAALAK